MNNNLNQINNQEAILSFANSTDISNKDKIILVLQSEYFQIEQEQKNIKYSNEEMKKYLDTNPEDPIILESIKINVDFFLQNTEKLKEIKQKIYLISGTEHPLYNKDLPTLDD